MNMRSKCSLGRATRKAGRALTKGLNLGTRVVPQARRKAPKRLTTKLWLHGAV